MMMSIYLDHAATTPVHPRVREAMQPYLTDHFGNPSSIHSYGRTARAAVEGSRDVIAQFLRVRPKQLVFTGSGTEADNMAIIGAAMANRERGNHIITTRAEHHAVLHTCEFLEENGFEVTYLPVDETGMVQVSALEQALRPNTILVSIIMGNNEVGTIQPIASIGQLLRDKQILFHTDAVQAFGLLQIDLAELPVDLLSASAHKINGPKGVGLLYVAGGVKLSPFIFGGSQERNRRAGTENVPGIVGFAEAVKLAAEEMENKWAQYGRLRQAMIETWQTSQIDFYINGHPEQYLPHILNVSFPGTDTETMLLNLDLAGIAAASGSACSSGSLELSHVLQAMCLDESRSRSAIRFSFGWGNTVEQVNQAAVRIAEIVKQLKGSK
ncbi:cysteine desulfurase [Brevibacillus humidisoli]|uniref:cysteine desulfurase family protein n=1 Tax=Brevibacillus humidisoli TaxID=2895522 RepID=UPI001E6418BD|nr:cysteine desulfurase family protein [Brevibacillus humidisoli]UFJ38985.1 cysteine desulfurase [Brevibacillus humidisoli]